MIAGNKNQFLAFSAACCRLRGERCIANPVTITVDDDAEVLRAVEPEPKCGLKHQV